MCQLPPPAPCPEEPPPPSPISNEPIPGAESDLAGAIAKERREAWAALAKECLELGDGEAMETAKELACPVVFTPLAGGGLQATIKKKKKNHTKPQEFRPIWG